jgi:hypothetical protein
MKLGCWWRNGRLSTVRLIVKISVTEDDVKGYVQVVLLISGLQIARLMTRSSGWSASWSSRLLLGFSRCF